MKAPKLFTYLSLFFSFTPFSLEYLVAHQVEDFSVIDGFTLSFFLFFLLTLLRAVSNTVMIITGISIALVSFIFIQINIEYFSMFHVFISYDVLPLFKDMYRAMAHFDLTPLYISILIYFITCLTILIFLCSKKYSRATFKSIAPLLAFSLSLGLLTNFVHSKRYTLMPQEIANGLKSINYSFESPIMFFFRSLPFLTSIDNSNLAYSKNVKTIAAALEKSVPITLPTQFSLSTYQNLIPEYPLYHLNQTKHLTFRHSPNNKIEHPQNKKNVILITLESIRAYETGVSNEATSLTPNLDLIAKEGLSAINAYSTNRVTVKSELSILCSRPDTQGGIPFSVYKSQVKMNCLPKILNQHGYETFWFHGNTKDFFNRGNFLLSLGFQHIYDKAAFIKDGHQEPDLGWGIDDHAFYAHTLNKLEQIKGPFFAELMSLSNHQPFKWDFKNFSFPKHLNYESDDIYQNYKRNIYYSDHALGKFYKAFKKSKLKDNTILVITGDHGVPFFPSNIKNESVKFKILFHTPLIIVDNTIKQDIIDTQVSHYDIAPTILSMLNIKENVMFIGRPFLGESKTFNDRPIYLDNMDNFGFLMGGLSCLPTKDHCDLSNKQCVKFENKLCHSTSLQQLELINEINPFKNYLSLLLEAGLI